jgi:hypothetical protein
MGFAYVPNQTRYDGDDPRRAALIDATYACLG